MEGAIVKLSTSAAQSPTPTPQPSTKSKPKGNVLRILSVANLVSLALVFLVAEIVAERHWFTLLIAYVPPLLAGVPTFILLPISLLLRNRAAIATSFIALILWFVFAGFALPFEARQRPPAPEDRLRVLTYNILLGSGGTDNIARVLRDTDADVICLQEAVAGFGSPDPLPALRARLPDYEFHRAGEVVIASRLPVMGVRSFPMVGISGRRGLVVTMRWREKAVSVIGVHFVVAATGETLARNRHGIPDYLNHTTETRREQVRLLRRETAAISHPFLICGDFNTPPRGIVYRALAQSYTDTFARAGFGFGWTYPARSPMLRIDHIFAANGFTAASAKVLSNSRTSDHRGILAEVFLR